MDENKSKVYIQIDTQNRITRCEGGYTIGNIKDFSQWILVDEGNGDRYNLCQSNYFDDGLYTEDGLRRYLYTGGKNYRLRTDAELAADRSAALRRFYAAPRNLTAGELVTIGGNLYKATVNIPFGEPVIDGQNAVKTTYEAELLAMQQKGN